MILKGLPNQYKAFIVVVMQNEKAQTFQNFKVSLRNFEENEKCTSENNVEPNTSIMRLNIGRNNSNNYNRNGNHHNKHKRNSNITCYSCGTPGHKSTECKLKQNINTNRNWCGHCKSSSHSEKACRYLQRNNNKDFANHIKTDDHTEYHFAFSISEGNYLSKVSDDNSLLVDCGATTRIINNDSLFVSVDEGYKPEEHFIELADGSRSNNVEKKRGTALVNIQDEHGNVRESTLNNALYVPSYPQNIFSVQAATKHGAKIYFSSGHAELI